MAQGKESAQGLALAWAVDAMNAAADRLTLASPSDPDLAFSAVGETLWWVCTVDGALSNRLGRDYRARTRDGIEDTYTPRLFAGLRYARNRFTHDVDVVDYVGMADREDSVLAWRWKSLPPIGTKRGNHGESEYETLLAGYPVRQVLVHACTFLRASSQALCS